MLDFILSEEENKRITKISHIFLVGRNQMFIHLLTKTPSTQRSASADRQGTLRYSFIGLQFVVKDSLIKAYLLSCNIEF